MGRLTLPASRAVFWVLVASTGLASGFAPDAPQSSSFRVVGYLPDYRLAAIDEGVAAHLTDLIVFSVEPTPTGDLKWGKLKPADLSRPKAMARRHGVRLLLCVGGWDRSSAFAAMSARAETRAAFVAAVIRACRRHGFDGVDIDWEHPANETEQRHYALLLSDLKAALAPQRLSLTIAMAGWQSLPPEAYRAVDRIHLMAYDAPGRHSTYEFAVAEVDRLISRGVPAAKITLGLPFYGRGISDRSRTVSYAEIVRDAAPAPGVDEAGGVYFNGRETIARKVKFARERGLAGVMIWELGQDAPGEASLLDAIRRPPRSK